MPKINVYLPNDLADAVREAQLPVSGICQAALERAVRDVSSARGVEEAPAEGSRVGLFGRFTPRAQRVMTIAEAFARDRAHDHVGTEHVLVGILDEGGNVAITVLTSLEIEPADVRDELVASMTPAEGRVEGHLPFAPLAKRALEATTKEALTLGHNYVGCEHLLLGVLATEDGLASRVLRRMGLELRTTRRAVVTALSGLVPARSEAPPVGPDALDQILQRLDAIERRLAG